MALPARVACAVIWVAAGVGLTARAEEHLLSGFLLDTHPHMAGADAAEAAAEALRNLPVLSKMAGGKQTELPAKTTPTASLKRARRHDSDTAAVTCDDQPEDLQIVVSMTTSRLRRQAERARQHQIRRNARMNQQDIERIYSLLAESSSHRVRASPLEVPHEGVSVVVALSAAVPVPVGSQPFRGQLSADVP